MSARGMFRRSSGSLARQFAPALGVLLIELASAAPARAQETIEYYGVDHLGSVRVVFDPAGALISRADNLPFGEVIDASSGSMPTQQFTGQARDGEAGQDYFHARMYQPRTGRLNAVDPIFIGTGDPQQWNRYAYARNNPMAYVDPSGMYTVTITTPDSNCRQSQGAYWCPGSFFAPNPFDPSSVDQIFDSNQQGYHGGQNDAAEQRYASKVATQFFSDSQWGKGQLGGGQVSNSSRRTILSKQEGGEGTDSVRPGERNVPSDGFFDSERPGVLFPISDGFVATFHADGNVSVSLTARGQFFSTIPGGFAALYIFGWNKNQWVDIGGFRQSLGGDQSWNPFFSQAAGNSPWPQ